jgi:hypothetical protein
VKFVPREANRKKSDMPPHLDIYVISPARNRETIERFLRPYVDRAASEDRGDEELMMLALDFVGSTVEWRQLGLGAREELDSHC